MLAEEKQDQMPLTGFKVLTFDCYGTLIDWERGIGEALKPLLDRTGRSLARDRAVEAHARHEADLEAKIPDMRYSDMLVLIHDRLAREWGVKPVPEESRAYGRSIQDWPAFLDSAPALQYLGRHHKLAILSNTDRQGFLASQARLQVDWDYIFTAEDVGAYKPDLRNFEHMLRELGKDGVQTQDILHIAHSPFHDLAPASQIGLASAWIRRQSDARGAGFPPGPRPQCHFRFPSLVQMTRAHQHFLRAV